MVEEILDATNAGNFSIYLSGDNNFRKTIYPSYKANRIGKPQPKWRRPCEEYLINEWNAMVTDGYEADDGLGIAATWNPDSIICSIDKDLRQVAGAHYNFVTKTLDRVSPERGLRTFYEQLLIGDPTDNIGGCPGVGKAKAPRLLDGCETEEEMFDAVRAAYKNDNLMKIYGQLLWIWRKEDDIWNPEKLRQEATTEPVVDQQ